MSTFTSFEGQCLPRTPSATKASDDRAQLAQDRAIAEGKAENAAVSEDERLSSHCKRPISFHRVISTWLNSDVYFCLL